MDAAFAADTDTDQSEPPFLGDAGEPPDLGRAQRGLEAEVAPVDAVRRQPRVQPGERTRTGSPSRSSSSSMIRAATKSRSASARRGSRPFPACGTRHRYQPPASAGRSGLLGGGRAWVLPGTGRAVRARLAGRRELAPLAREPSGAKAPGRQPCPRTEVTGSPVRVCNVVPLGRTASCFRKRKGA